MKIALLTNNEHSNIFRDDQLTLPYFKQNKIEVAPLVWTNVDVNNEKDGLRVLKEFDAIIIRSPWDYHKYFDQFLKFLNFCHKNQIKIFNPYHILLWNLNKHYLDELESKNLSTIPTVWTKSAQDYIQIEKLLDKYSTIIFKPAVSAGSANTFKLTKNNLNEHTSTIKEVMEIKECMLQPYLKEIETEGELSLIYFAGKFSHAIVKKPKQGDFRVQDKFGGSIESITPPKQAQDLANQTIEYIQTKFKTTLLYARMDLVKWQKNWVIIEAEVVEPHLYFQYDINSAEKFVKAVQSYLLK